MQISSVRNPLLQKIRKAVSNGRPTDDGLIVAEGPHLVEEALKGSWPIAQVITTPQGRTRHADLLQQVGIEPVEVSARTFESAVETQHSQQILALLQPRSWDWPDLLGTSTPLVVVLDGIQDPGNAGTIVRSAEAFGATGVVLLKGSAHVANGKLLRASAGSIFRVPFLEQVDATALLKNAADQGISVYALDACARLTVMSADLTLPLIFVIGNEGKGVSPSVRSHATCLSIPMSRVESVNAAVAGSVALFAAQLQRRAI
jgi:RNA methyltransferase, TrmH family